MLFREPGSAQALLFLEREVQFIAPDYLEIEFLSAISKKVRAGLFGKEEASLKREQFLKLPVRLIPVELICELAFELATEYPITFYDAMFLATAIDQKRPPLLRLMKSWSDHWNRHLFLRPFCR